MDCRVRSFIQTQNGQTTLEFALLLPAMALTLAALLQLLIVVHLKLRLNQSAVRIASVAAIGGPAAAIVPLELAHYMRTMRWGLPLPGSFFPGSTPISQWQSYPGVGTSSDPGKMITEDLVYHLKGDVLVDHLLPSLTLREHVEVPLELSVPSSAS